jgi:hypothetical protein
MRRRAIDKTTSMIHLQAPMPLASLPCFTGPTAMSTAITASANTLGKLTPGETALLVCDVQERFRPIISGFSAVVDTSRRMVRRNPALKTKSNERQTHF